MSDKTIHELIEAKELRCYAFSVRAAGHYIQAFTPAMLDQTPEAFLKTQFIKDAYISQQVNLSSDCIYKNAGWLIDFRPYLKMYLVKAYGNWYESYAPSVKALRDTFGMKIQKLVCVSAERGRFIGTEDFETEDIDE